MGALKKVMAKLASARSRLADFIAENPECEPYTLDGAKRRVREGVLEGGIDCPCCGARCRQYRRHLYSTVAAELIALYKITHVEGQESAHVSELMRAVPHRGGGGDMAHARWWGLCSATDTQHVSERPRTGYWKITTKGVLFVQGKIRVPAYAVLYRGGCLGLGGPKVSIKDVLDTQFDYAELMEG